MKIEDQVVSLEIVREMKELGAPQDSFLSWITLKRESPYVELTKWVKSNYGGLKVIKDEERYAAPTVAELGEMLPEGYWSSGNVTVASDDIYYCGFINILEAPEIFDETVYSNTEADARAKMWICLKKEGLI